MIRFILLINLYEDVLPICQSSIKLTAVCYYFAQRNKFLLKLDFKQTIVFIFTVRLHVSRICFKQNVRHIFFWNNFKFCFLFNKKEKFLLCKFWAMLKLILVNIAKLLYFTLFSKVVENGSYSRAHHFIKILRLKWMVLI